MKAKSTHSTNKSATSKRTVTDIEKVKAEIKEYKDKNATLSTQLIREKAFYMLFLNPL